MLCLETKPIPLNQKYSIWNNRNIRSKKWKEAEEALRFEIQSQWKGNVKTGAVQLSIVFYFGDKRRRDIDAYIKILLDCMEGVVYEDDVQINEMHCVKEYDKERPRTEIRVL